LALVENRNWSLAEIDLIFIEQVLALLIQDDTNHDTIVHIQGQANSADLIATEPSYIREL